MSLHAKMEYEHKTMVGSVRWDDKANSVEDWDDPAPPEGEGWRLVGTALGELRHSSQLIVWSWERGIR